MLPSDRFEILVEAARPCLSRAYLPKRLATRMHLIAESLQDRRPLPVGPFDVESERGKIIADLKRSINERHGRFPIHLLPSRMIW
jgi:DNA polymerase V